MDQAQPPVPAAPAQPQAQPGAQPDPQSKEMFKKLIMAGYQIVYDGTVAKGLVEMMKSQADDPAQAVAHAAMAVIGKMRESVKGIPPDAVYTAAPAIMVFLFDIAKAANLFEADKNTFAKAIQDLGQMTQQEQAPEQPQTQPQQPPGLISGAMQPGA